MSGSRLIVGRENADVSVGCRPIPSKRPAQAGKNRATTMTDKPNETIWTPQKGQVGETNYKLEPQLVSQIVEGVKSYIAAYQLDTTTTVKITRTKRGGRKGPQPTEKSTLSDYMLYIRQIGEFAGRIGDFRTATICMRKSCPSNPHPADPSTLVLFFKWKSGKQGEQLMDLKGHAVKDILGRTITCTGDYHTPQCLNKCDGAIKALHDTYEHLRGTYQEPCKNCLTANNMSTVQPTHFRHSYASCNSHANNPKISYQGDPCLSDTYKKHYEEIRNFLNATHKVRGNAQLSPSMLRRLHSNLTTGNDIFDFQLWTMIIIGTSLFLRADELLNLKIEDFDMKYNIVHPTSIRNVAVWVQGKCDAGPQLLSIWKNDEFPELCPIRPLFCYLKSTGIRAGYLFPNRKFLSAILASSVSTGPSVKPTGDPTEKLKYKSWLVRIKRTLIKTFPHMFGPDSPSSATVGTHTLRKTGYLVAVWGVLRAMNLQFGGVRATDFKPNLLFEDILRCARHKSVGMASNYVLDAISQHERVQEERFLSAQVVSVWKSFKIDEVQHAGDINAASLPHIQPNLPLQVDYWYTVEAIYYRGDSVSKMFEEVCVKRETKSSEERLLQLVGELSDEKAKEAKWLIDEIQRSQLVATAQSSRAICSGRAGEYKKNPGDDFSTSKQPPKKKQARGSLEFDHERAVATALEKEYKRSPSTEKGGLVLGAWDAFYRAVENAGGYNALKDGTPRKYYTNRRKNKAAIQQCIAQCCNGDANKFWEAFECFPTVYGKVYTCTHTTISPLQE